MTALPARGAEVTIEPDRIRVQRSELAGSLWPDVDRAPADLIGWYRQSPGNGSVGYIELLFPDATPRINFSPGDEELYRAIDHRLTMLQAGYSLDDVSEQEWIAAASSEAAVSASNNNTDGGDTVAEAGGDPKAEKGAHGGAREGGKKRQPAPWAKVATPDEVPEANKDADIDGPIYGQVVCVTGDVEPYDKGDVWDMIASRGGTVAKNVTKKTTMLIVGEWSSMTTKEKRARELKDKGQEIQIVPFAEFLEMAGKA